MSMRLDPDSLSKRFWRDYGLLYRLSLSSLPASDELPVVLRISRKPKFPLSSLPS